MNLFIVAPLGLLVVAPYPGCFGPEDKPPPDPAAALLAVVGRVICAPPCIYFYRMIITDEIYRAVRK